MTVRDRMIKVENLTKIYRLYDRPVDRLKESVSPFRRKYHREFYALNDISFELEKGENLGIVGRNGSGKSTLLKLLTGVLAPTRGTMEINGKISALLELGAGFNPEMTGLENIYFSGSIMGYGKKEMDVHLDDILSFADIGDYIDQPVRTYSSGMYVRLAFSIATSVKPDILIVDEALSVGDMFFQAKCMVRMKKMIDDGTALLFVSHDTGSVKSLCRKAMLLERGQILDFGNADSVVGTYFSMKVQGQQQIATGLQTAIAGDPGNIFAGAADFNRRAAYQRIRNGKASFANIQLLDENGEEISVVDYGQKVTMRMAFEISEDLSELGCGYNVQDNCGINLVYSDSAIENRSIRDARKGDRYIVDWTFVSSLQQGQYNVLCVLAVPVDLDSGIVDFCDRVPLGIQFRQNARPGSPLYGKVHWENAVNVRRIRGDLSV